MGWRSLPARQPWGWVAPPFQDRFERGGGVLAPGRDDGRLQSGLVGQMLVEGGRARN
jgi:hypothetical protein